MEEETVLTFHAHQIELPVRALSIHPNCQNIQLFTLLHLFILLHSNQKLNKRRERKAISTPIRNADRITPFLWAPLLASSLFPFLASSIQVSGERESIIFHFKIQDKPVQVTRVGLTRILLCKKSISFCFVFPLDINQS